MGHVFISYSHKDTEYAHALAANLQSRGLDVWIDERLDYGSQWPRELQKQLDTCAAFILIMSPRSYESEWVQSELQRARRKLKPIFPLLLEGSEPWLSVESTQYYDVRGEQHPDAKFYSAIERVLASSGGQVASSSADTAKPVQPKSSGNVPKLRIGMALAALVALVALFAVILSSLRSNASGEPDPTPSEPVASPVPLTSSAELESPTTTPEVPVSSENQDTADFIDPQGVPMRLVPAGNFTMGSDRGYDDEKPVHSVYLDDFYIDKYEVTNARYKACVDGGICRPPQKMSSFTRDGYYGNPEYVDYPVVYVEWEDADAYCKWRDMDLPSEAQWEKAARGGDGRVYPWGNTVDHDRANFNDNVGDTTAVGNYENGKSPYGIYDMAGNVWEWVRDWYSSTYYLNTPLTNPLGPESGEFRILRGGSWHDDERIVRTSNRGWSQVEYFYNVDFGFRCAWEGNP